MKQCNLSLLPLNHVIVAALLWRLSIISFQHKLKSPTDAAFPGSSEVGDVRKEVKATVSKAIKKFGPDALKGFLPYFQYFPLCGNSLDFIVLF